VGSTKEIIADLKKLANKEKAEFLPRFFKTGKGEYGYGDRFHGIVVSDQRTIAKKYYARTSKETIQELLHSNYHEERLTAVFILSYKFNDASKNGKEQEWVKFYLNNARRINNWDLVDSSAHIILGKWLEDKDRKILYKLASSDSLWENRIAVVATWHFIRKQNDVADILALAKIMLQHPHDLMHKATGWMLREGWKVKPKEIEAFLDTHVLCMPRTMLRYAIEKMEEKKRKGYLLFR
jgi:3-methyladenine DNA glycosylase AlkD